MGMRLVCGYEASVRAFSHAPLTFYDDISCSHDKQWSPTLRSYRVTLYPF